MHYDCTLFSFQYKSYFKVKVPHLGDFMCRNNEENFD